MHPEKSMEPDLQVMCTVVIHLVGINRNLSCSTRSKLTNLCDHPSNNLDFIAVLYTMV